MLRFLASNLSQNLAKDRQVKEHQETKKNNYKYSECESLDHGFVKNEILAKQWLRYFGMGRTTQRNMPKWSEDGKRNNMLG